MKKNVTIYNDILLIGLGILLVGFPTNLFADTPDPFSFDNGHWISFDHYKENIKNGKSVPESSATSNINDQLPPVDSTNEKNKSSSPINNVPIAAGPTRPINLPLLPGLNKGYDIQVNSTEDDRSRLTAQILNLDSDPKVVLPDANWQNANEAANRQNHELGEDGLDTQIPINVRMSYLPNPDIRPTPPINKSTPKLSSSDLISQKYNEPKKSKEEVAACAAVDAFKKKQLEAIQSDRKTLAALQAAIAQLGLQKELSFMAGANSSMESQVNLDFPAPSNK